MNRPLRLLLLAYYCPPAGGPAVQRPEMLLRYCPPGVTITVITAALEDYQAFSPLRMPLDPQRFIPGQTVHRLNARRPYRFFRLLAAARLYGLVRWCYCPDIAGEWGRSAVRLAVDLHAQDAFDAVITVAPPFSVALAGRDIARRFSIPWISDFGDLWADYLRGAWPTRFHHARDASLEAGVLRDASVTVMWTPGSRRHMLAKYPSLDSARVDCVTGGFEPADFPPAPRFSAGKFVIAYTGVFCGPEEPAGWLRPFVQGRSFRPRQVDLSTDSPVDLLRAMESLNDPRIEFRQIGPTDALNLRLFAQSSARPDIKTLGYLPHRDALAELHNADAAYLCLTTILGQPRNEQVPQKLFEYLGARKPVLAPIQDGDAKDFLTQSGLAICAPPRQPGALAVALRDLVAAKFDGRRAVVPRDDFIRRFEWSALADSFFGIVGRAVSSFHGTSPALPVAEPHLSPTT